MERSIKPSGEATLVLVVSVQVSREGVTRILDMKRAVSGKQRTSRQCRGNRGRANSVGETEDEPPVSGKQRASRQCQGNRGRANSVGETEDEPPVSEKQRANRQCRASSDLCA